MLAPLVLTDVLEVIEAPLLSVGVALDVVVSQSSQVKLPESVQLAGMVGMAEAELADVEEMVCVQSSQALPFSEGQGQ